MGRAAGVVLGLLILGLWLSSAFRNQQAVGGEERTVQVQMTAVAQPPPSPTP